MNAVAQPRVRFGIFWRLLLVLLAVSLVPVTALWYANYAATAGRLEQQVQQNMEEVLTQLGAVVDGWVDTNQRMLQQNALLTAIRGMKAEQQTPVLRAITQQYPWVYLAFTVAADGSNIARSDGNPLTAYGDRKYVQEVLAGARRADEVVIGKTSGKPALIMAVPIHDDANKIIGVLAIASTVEKISDRIAQRKIGATGGVFLVDEKGKVVAHQSEDLAKARQDLSAHPVVAATRKEDRRQQIAFEGKRGEPILGVGKLTERQWVLVVQQEREEAFADLAKSNRDSMMLLALTILPVVMIAFLISRSFTQPIRNLTQIADAISVGKMDLKIAELDRKDEIGVLAAAIDRLRTSMAMAMERLKRKA